MFNSKLEELSLLFIKNKIYSRLNLIIIDIFNNEEDYISPVQQTQQDEYNSNTNIIFQRVFTILLKLFQYPPSRISTLFQLPDALMFLQRISNNSCLSFISLQAIYLVWSSTNVP